MADKPEAKVKKKIDDILKKYDVWYCKPRGTMLGKAGVPDYLCCFHRQFIAIEAKSGKSKPTALQKKELTEIKNHGGWIFVINEHNLDFLDDMLKAMDHNGKAGKWHIFDEWRKQHEKHDVL